MITMDDIRREIGDAVYGDKKTETRIDAIARGYTSGSKETVYDIAELTKTPVKEDPKSEDKDSTESVDIFGDEDDDI